MAARPSQPFFVGPGGKPVSASQLKQHRAVQQAIMQRLMGSTPSNVGEGLSALGNAFAYRAMASRNDAAEEMGRAAYDDSFSALGDNPSRDQLLAASPNGFETDGQRAIWQALMESSLEGPDWQTFEQGGDIFRFDANDENSVPELWHDGPADPLKAPAVETRFNLETGLEEKVQWDPAIGDWVPLGGMKAPTNGLTVTTNPDGTTTITQGGTGKYGQTVDGGMGDMMTSIQKDAFAAISGLNTLDAMTEAMKDPNFYSGFGGEQVKALKQAAVAIGIANPESVTSMETFNAMAKQAALDTMGGSLGTGFSNADRSFVEQQVAGITNTPEGNAALMDIQRKMARRRIQIATLADQYAKEHGKLDSGFTTALAQWAEQNPLFGTPETAALPDPFGMR
ncbi:hypothetical protein [Devosia sp. 66-22]|uniref:hypothetical protein n=1 Tax=Devosia sp. 66-22 TaxID=1895753 RepID=UPI002632ACFF|nr:hypothetical protein [Devosia sp. 66-22]